MRSVLELEQWHRAASIYAVILGHFAALRTGRSAEAKDLLETAHARCDKSLWPYPIVRYLRKEIDEPTLLAAATDHEKEIDARCFVGLDCLMKGMKEKALAHFRWVKDHASQDSRRNSLQTAISLRELEAIDGKPGR